MGNFYGNFNASDYVLAHKHFLLERNPVRLSFHRVLSFSIDLPLYSRSELLVCRFFVSKEKFGHFLDKIFKKIFKAVEENLLTVTFSTVRRFVMLVSPGFEPRQRESKSLVLPLHHETTQCECSHRGLRAHFYHMAWHLASIKYVLRSDWHVSSSLPGASNGYLSL